MIKTCTLILCAIDVKKRRTEPCDTRKNIPKWMYKEKYNEMDVKRDGMVQNDFNGLLKCFLRQKVLLFLVVCLYIYLYI